MSKFKYIPAMRGNLGVENNETDTKRDGAGVLCTPILFLLFFSLFMGVHSKATAVGVVMPDKFYSALPSKSVVVNDEPKKPECVVGFRDLLCVPPGERRQMDRNGGGRFFLAPDNFLWPVENRNAGATYVAGRVKRDDRVVSHVLDDGWRPAVVFKAVLKMDGYRRLIFGVTGFRHSGSRFYFEGDTVIFDDNEQPRSFGVYDGPSVEHGGVGGFFSISQAFADQIQLPNEQTRLRSNREDQQNGGERQKPRRYSEAPFVRRFFEALPFAFIAIGLPIFGGLCLSRKRYGLGISLVLLGGLSPCIGFGIIALSYWPATWEWWI